MYEQLAKWFAGEEGEELASLAFEFNTPFGLLTSLLLIIAVGAGVAWFYAPKIHTLPSRSWWSVLLLRAFVVMLLLYLLMDPSLIGQKISPGEQSILLLFDDSKSMQITGGQGKSRGQRLQEAYQETSEEMLERLKKKYQVLTYRFGDTVDRIAEIQNLTLEQPESNILKALETTAQEWEGVDIAAMAVFSDGAQHPQRAVSDLDRSIVGETPVFTVGVGQETKWQDIAIDKFSVKRTHFDKSPVVVNADVKAMGVNGYKVKVDVLEGSQIAKSETVTVERDYQVIPIHLEFVPSVKGWVDCTLRIRLEERKLLQESAVIPDRIEENNFRRFVVDNNDKEYRILYVSGRPNWELKFVGRALKDDDQLKLTRLIRISAAEKKFEYRGERTSTTNPLFEGFANVEERYGRYDESIFLRMGADESELTKGFPSDAEELFDYDLVVFGEAERELFTTNQLELVREFVSKRGGALLMTGGAHSFEYGGYKGSPLESVLPVVMESDPDEDFQNHRGQEPFLVLPTMEGDISGAFMLEKDRSASQSRWGDMPMLYGLNDFAITRAGASVWLRSLQKDQELHDKAVFAIQRYGKGKAAVLATGSTWSWHMSTEEEPSPHHRVWRQIVRSMVHDVPNAIDLRAKQEAYFVGETIPLDTMIRDEAFDPRESVRTSITVTAPTGKEMTLAVDESIEEPGLYQSEFVPEEPGNYKVAIQAKDENKENLGYMEESILVQPNHQEWLKPEYNPAFLKELSNETGGEFLELAELNTLSRRIPWEPTEESEIVRIHLWHWWGFYLLIPILMSIEWYIRRKRGLA